jgi:hypothetical protein
VTTSNPIKYGPFVHTAVHDEGLNWSSAVWG